MARIDDNDMVEGIRGKVGKSIVYKKRNGKTFATKYPDRTPVSKGLKK